MYVLKYCLYQIIGGGSVKGLGSILGTIFSG